MIVALTMANAIISTEKKSMKKAKELYMEDYNYNLQASQKNMNGCRRRRCKVGDFLLNIKSYLF